MIIGKKMAYRVGSDMDTLILAVGNQLVALQTRVTLDLVGGGNNTSGLDEGLEL
jgi:hypothetical protein